MIFELLVVIAFQSPILFAKMPGTRYKPFPENSLRNCTLYDARKPILSICLSGEATPADLERARNWATRATLTWFRALKVIDRNVTRTIRFSCQDPDLSIRLRPGKGTSFASPGVTTIYLSRPYGTWTHELGHALAGLGDTYVGGAGSCGGQPQSLMCWGAYGPRANPEEWSTLWPDDILGIQKNYQKLYSDLQAPSWAGEIALEKPLDPSKPWPDGIFLAPGPGKHKVVKIPGGPTPIDHNPNTTSIDE